MAANNALTIDMSSIERSFKSFQDRVTQLDASLAKSLTSVTASLKTHSVFIDGFIAKLPEVKEALKKSASSQVSEFGKVASEQAKTLFKEMKTNYKKDGKYGVSNKTRDEALDAIATPTATYLSENLISMIVDRILKKPKLDPNLLGFANEGLIDGAPKMSTPKGPLEESLSKRGGELAQKVALDVNNVFGKMFFDLLRGQFSDLGGRMKELFNAILEDIAKSLGNVLLDVIKSKAGEFLKSVGGSSKGGPDIFGSIGKLFGLGGPSAAEVASTMGLATSASVGYSGIQALGFVNAFELHDGGYVVPRFHSGGLLRRDEVPAILQTGEGVLSRRGMSSLDALNAGKAPSGPGGGQAGGNTTIVIQAWDSQDVEKFVRRHAQLFTGVSIREIERNGALRAAIAGA